MCPALSSSRWCPTPEQLMILEEMYRAGTRTPNATQIQHITSHLSLFGRIEGKNVFYWFQNHKARDRLKLRRNLTKQLQLQQQHQTHHHHQFLSCSCFYHQSHLSNFQPLPVYNSTPAFLPQGGIQERGRYTAAVAQKVEIENPNPMMGMYGGDWMMMTNMMDVGPSIHNRQPPKTLELFPIKPSN